MALFSRRRPDSSRGEGDAAPQTEPAPDAPNAKPDSADPPTEGSAASVGISVSTFRGVGAQPPTSPPTSESPASTAPATGAGISSPGAETVPGLRDNVLLRDALARLPESPSPQNVMDAARQLLQGHLFLRVKGDARALLAQGSELPLVSATVGERRFAVAYSSGRALADSIRTDGDTDTTAMGQPVLSVLRHLLASNAEGLLLDPASAPRRALLPRDLIERMVSAADEQLTLKTLLAGERTDETPGLLAEALARTTAWAAVGRIDGGDARGIAEGRTADGRRFLEVYSHPLEVVAMGRGDDPTPMSPAQLSAALRAEEGLSGVVIDSRGPWARLAREQLAPVLALG